MTSFADKVRELMANAEALPEDTIQQEAQSFLGLARDWPVETQVPLSRVAFVIAAMLMESNIHERRVMLTDSIRMRDFVG
jgi:hypothetical protein